ncbi:MAG: M28 family peptidase [Anaerolineaceae bacterium]|nr:M28 family peptidase [Anaerolineaceae bacterium]
MDRRGEGAAGQQGLCRAARSSDDQILGVVNLDMIAYNSAEFPAPVLDLHADSTLPETVDLAHLFDGVVDAYGLALEPKVMVDDSLRTRSDSWAFVEQDYPAILAIEDYDDFSPYYHTVADRLSTLDLAYYAEFVRAVIATVAHAGCFPRGGLMGHVYDASTEAAIPGAAVTLEDSLGITYAVSSDGTGAYALEAMAGVYTATVSPPGYLPGLLGGVVVPTDTIGIQDLALTPIGPLDWRIYLPFVGHSGR